MVSTFDTARIIEDRIDMPSRIEVDMGRTGDAVFAPIPTGPDIVIGSATDIREYPPVRYLVVATKLDRPWPGTDKEVTFAVQRLHLVSGGRYESHTSWGFFEEAECWRFLTLPKTNWIAFSTWDLRGNEVREKRRGRGVPEGMTSRHPEEISDDAR